MKIVFLDIDGVLKTGNTNFARDKEPWKAFNPLSVHLVSELCFESKANVVISSNWRTEFNRVDMKNILGKVGYFLYVDKNDWRTDNLGPKRGHEIKRWLCDRADIDSYVILDDQPETEFQHLEGSFVGTKNYEGFLQDHYHKALRILNR